MTASVVGHDRYAVLHAMDWPELRKGLDILGAEHDAGQVHVPTFCAYVDAAIPKLPELLEAGR